MLNPDATGLFASEAIHKQIALDPLLVELAANSAPSADEFRRFRRNRRPLLLRTLARLLRLAWATLAEIKRMTLPARSRCLSLPRPPRTGRAGKVMPVVMASGLLLAVAIPPFALNAGMAVGKDASQRPVEPTADSLVNEILQGRIFGSKVEPTSAVSRTLRTS